MHRTRNRVVAVSPVAFALAGLGGLAHADLSDVKICDGVPSADALETEAAMLLGEPQP